MYVALNPDGITTLGRARRPRVARMNGRGMGATTGNCPAIDVAAPPRGFHWEWSKNAQGCNVPKLVADTAALPAGECVPAADLAPNWRQTLLSNTDHAILPDTVCSSGARYVSKLACPSPGLSPGVNYLLATGTDGCPKWVAGAPAPACTIPGMSLVNGACVCPTGQSVINGACALPSTVPATGASSLITDIEGLFAKLPNPFPSFPTWEVYGAGALAAWFFFFRKKGRY